MLSSTTCARLESSRKRERVCEVRHCKEWLQRGRNGVVKIDGGSPLASLASTIKGRWLIVVWTEDDLWFGQKIGNFENVVWWSFKARKNIEYHRLVINLMKCTLDEASQNDKGKTWRLIAPCAVFSVLIMIFWNDLPRSLSSQMHRLHGQVKWVHSCHAC